MHSYGYDREAAALVSVVSGEPRPEEDGEQLIQTVTQMRRDAAHRPEGTVWILVADPGQKRPNAALRKRFAEARREALHGPPYRLALVTESSLIRGVFNAMGLLVPSRPEDGRCAVATFYEALLWCEQQRGCYLPVLRRLHDQARRSDLRLAS